jgi:uncharacterized protein (TIGR01777 family)
MKVLIAGGAGFIGSFLRRYFLDLQHDVFVLTRRAQKNYGRCVFLSYAQEWPDNIDVVINLAGTSLAEHRWNNDTKESIRESRIQTTRALVQKTLAQASLPKIFIQASAAGIYGHMPEPINESAAIFDQHLFSQRLCLDWEQESLPLEQSQCRLVLLRLGMVIHPQYGVLKELLPSFKWGLGATLGSGTQPFPWIDIDDLVRAVAWIIENDSLSGPIHLAAPELLSQKKFAQILAQQLKRPYFLRLPRFVVTALFGQMGQELLLQGANLVPQKLLDSGFIFNAPTLEQSLQSWLYNK